ncbi:hypothetical protein [Paenibacillus sp. M2]|uniref:hypothetical protein n=1 Tax=Paenibacillus sp. M2 TaxID=3341793 RepID=UPI00398A0FD9
MVNILQIEQYSSLAFHLDTNVPPDEFTLVEYVNGKARPISLREGSFQLEQEK